MDKVQLTRVLIRVIGVWMIAAAVPRCVSGLATLLWFNPSLPAPVRAYFVSLAMPLLSVAIGLYLFFKGAWIARKLVSVDETIDP